MAKDLRWAFHNRLTSTITWSILGDMVYFNVLGQHFLVLGSLQRTTDLFENRSLNYSDRMRLPMLVELCVLDSFTSQPFKLFLFVPEWGGISPSLFCHTAQHGRNTGAHFESFSITMRCPNTNLFKSERSTRFCVDYLTHLAISSATFDSKRHAYAFF